MSQLRLLSQGSDIQELTTDNTQDKHVKYNTASISERYEDSVRSRHEATLNPSWTAGWGLILLSTRRAWAGPHGWVRKGSLRSRPASLMFRGDKVPDTMTVIWGHFLHWLPFPGAMPHRLLSLWWVLAGSSRTERACPPAHLAWWKAGETGQQKWWQWPKPSGWGGKPLDRKAFQLQKEPWGGSTADSAQWPLE